MKQEEEGGDTWQGRKKVEVKRDMGEKGRGKGGIETKWRKW